MFIVSGGAGLIGSSLVWHMNNLGIDDIFLVDHIGVSDKWRNLRALSFSDYAEKDVFRRKLTEGAFDKLKIDGILHLGACSATTERDGSYLADNNYEASCELAEFAARREIPMLYASSCATYGGGEAGYEDDESRIETLRPLNMYGYSKQMFDLWAKRHGLLKHLIGCKFSNVYGPNELHKGEMRSVVCRAFEQISDCGKMKLFRSYRSEYADGEQMRDFLYVKDAVKMIWFLFETRKGGIYNIGSGRAETWNSLAAAAFKAMNRPFNVEYIDMPESLRDRYQYYTKTEMAKLYALGYRDEPMSLDDAVADYWQYWSQNKFLGDE